ncbi:MAG: polymer-forming cytoskeletal family protein [Spirochaetes bacterium]|jgi:cytoskeletal protein CcmA (bactofilin family)|nr:polymer-forming cytoskeletal family protein [Spirochaetota bacterium]
MAKNARKNKDLPRISTRLGKRTSFNGRMRFTQPVKISGRFEGEIIAEGFLYIEEGAYVRADVTADAIVIAGEVHGNVQAARKVEMLPTGKIYGNVRTAKLRIADGVVFEGKCDMLRNSDSIDVFSAPVEQLKESAQRV